jgi:hypothetical protein
MFQLHGIPWNAPGADVGSYAYLEQQTIQAVDDAVHTGFPPKSKRIPSCHRVTKPGCLSSKKLMTRKRKRDL